MKRIAFLGAFAIAIGISSPCGAYITEDEIRRRLQSPYIFCSQVPRSGLQHRAALHAITRIYR